MKDDKAAMDVAFEEWKSTAYHYSGGLVFPPRTEVAFNGGFAAGREAERREDTEDTVPRSRYDACNKDWLREKAAVKHLAASCASLLKRAEKAEAREREILQKVEDVKTDHHQRDGRSDGYDLDTCDEIIRRIKLRQPYV